LYQHADDTTVTVRDEKSITETFKSMNIYCAGTGSKLNLQKSEVLVLGKAKGRSTIEHLPVIIKTDYVEVLGVFLGPEKQVCETLNWDKKMSRLKTILAFWSQRKLTLPGKATAINALIVSRLIYLINVQPVPQRIEQEFCKLCQNFLWPKTVLIKRNTMIGKRCDGGLNIPDIQLK
jgi:hypothetical protein